jgi:hypothetical protein
MNRNVNRAFATLATQARLRLCSLLQKMRASIILTTMPTQIIALDARFQKSTFPSIDSFDTLATEYN